MRTGPSEHPSMLTMDFDVHLTLSTLEKNQQATFLKYFICFFSSRIRHIKQIVSLGDNLHEMSKYIFWENKKIIIRLSSAEFAQRVVKV